MPFNLKPPRVFYGWWIVATTLFIAIYTGGVVFFGFTAIFEPIANEFGWDYAQISFAASLRGLEMGLLSPLVGILVDRWGPRKLITGGISTVALGLLLLSQTNSLAMFYIAFGVVAVGVSASTTTVLMTAVANWFRKKLSLATGIATCGFGLGGLLIPVIVRLVDLYEWRMTLIILALSALVFWLPSTILIRDKPEQYGYLPDGEENAAAVKIKSAVPAQTVEADNRLKEVLKSRAFWHISLALTAQMTVLMAVITHVMPYLSSVGVARSTSSLVAMVIPLVSISGRLGVGWLGDKLNKKWVTVSAFIFMILGLFCFEYIVVERSWLLVPFLILFGISFGGNVPMRVALLMEYFGRRNFGTVLGFMLGIIALISMTGPPLAGWIFDTWGSYQGTWLGFAVLAFAGLIIMATIPPARTTQPA